MNSSEVATGNSTSADHKLAQTGVNKWNVINVTASVNITTNRQQLDVAIPIRYQVNTALE